MQLWIQFHVENVATTRKYQSGKSDPVKFKRFFLTGAFWLAKMWILQATFLLWGIGLLRDKFASKNGQFGLLNVPFRNPI